MSETLDFSDKDRGYQTIPDPTLFTAPALSMQSSSAAFFLREHEAFFLSTTDSAPATSSSEWVTQPYLLKRSGLAEGYCDAPLQTLMHAE